MSAIENAYIYLGAFIGCLVGYFYGLKQRNVLAKQVYKPKPFDFNAFVSRMSSLEVQGQIKEGDDFIITDLEYEELISDPMTSAYAMPHTFRPGFRLLGYKMYPKSQAPKQ